MIVSSGIWRHLFEGGVRNDPAFRLLRTIHESADAGFNAGRDAVADASINAGRDADAGTLTSADYKRLLFRFRRLKSELRRKWRRGRFLFRRVSSETNRPFLSLGVDVENNAVFVGEEDGKVTKLTLRIHDKKDGNATETTTTTTTTTAALSNGAAGGNPDDNDAASSETPPFTWIADDLGEAILGVDVCGEFVATLTRHHLRAWRKQMTQTKRKKMTLVAEVEKNNHVELVSMKARKTYKA